MQNVETKKQGAAFRKLLLRNETWAAHEAVFNVQANIISNYQYNKIRTIGT